MYTNCTLAAHEISKMKRGEDNCLSLERTTLAVFQPQINSNVLENNIAGCTVHDVLHTLPSVSLLSEYHGTRFSVISCESVGNVLPSLPRFS